MIEVRHKNVYSKMYGSLEVVKAVSRNEKCVDNVALRADGGQEYCIVKEVNMDKTKEMTEIMEVACSEKKASSWVIYP